jgi:hypothetical protein
MTTDKTNYRVTLLKFLVEKKQDGLLALLWRVSQEERIQMLRIMLGGAAKRHNDAEACMLLEAMLRATDDITALDRTDEAGRYPDNESCIAHDDASKTARMAMVIDAWSLFPSGGDGTIREFVAQDESREVPCKVATLPKTKSLAISTALDFWHMTPNDGAARETMAWLLDVYASMQFQEDHALFTEAVRRRTDHSARASRLLEAYRMTSEHKKLNRHGGVSEPARIFAIGWLRGAITRNDGPSIIAIADALMSSSMPAYDRVLKMAEQTRAKDILMRRFVAEAFSGRYAKYGVPTFKYLDNGEPEITVRLPRGDAWESLEERRNQAHDEFGKIRDRVQAWLHLNIQELKVHLVVIIPGATKGDDPLFERSQYI